MSYEENRQWADPFTPQILEIIRSEIEPLFHNQMWCVQHPELLYNYSETRTPLKVKAEIASDYQDMKEATDGNLFITIGTARIPVGIRIRRSSCQFRDFTVRAKKGHVERKGMEIDKITHTNNPIWYFYGWCDQYNTIAEYMVFDVALLRQKQVLDIYYKLGKILLNGDAENTGFISIPRKEISEVGAIIKIVLDPMWYHINKTKKDESWNPRLDKTYYHGKEITLHEYYQINGWDEAEIEANWYAMRAYYS